MIRIAALLLALAALAGCAAPPAPTAPTTAPTTGQAPPRPEAALRDVAARVGPAAEAECLRRVQDGNCDFTILLDTRPGAPPNAFQTRDRRNRPVLVLSAALLEDVRNADELAFILGHEAAHHIAGHMELSQACAEYGALILGSMAEAAGQTGPDLARAAAIGAELGRLRFSKEFELEADALGTVIAFRAGFDPVRGAAFFARIPDPGDRFLGTHPPNAARQAVVARIAAGLAQGAAP